jgi:RNA polymerase sigma factor for flagellar operon FliA
MPAQPSGPRFGFLGTAGPSRPITALTGDQVVAEYGNIVEGALRRLPRAVRSSAVTDLDDLRQEGLLALIQAARVFDPARQVPFPPYALRCIENALTSALRKQDVLPESVRKDARALRTVEEEHRRSAEPLTVFELSFYSGLSEERVLQVQEWLHREQAVALDGEDDIDAGSTASAEETLLAEEEARTIIEALKRLPARSRRILLARVIHDTPVRTVAMQEGLSPARVSQIYGTVTEELLSLIKP